MANCANPGGESVSSVYRTYSSFRSNGSTGHALYSVSHSTRQGSLVVNVSKLELHPGAPADDCALCAIPHTRNASQAYTGADLYLIF